MNRYIAAFVLTRTRTIVETATATAEVTASDFGDAGDQAEGLSPDFSDPDWKLVSDVSDVGTNTLTGVALAATAPSSPDGLPPAVYDPEPSPSGDDYNFVQVEPTPAVQP